MSRDAAKLRHVGRPLPRAAAGRLAAGRGDFLDDVDWPGQLHAAFLRSPHPHAAIAAVDLAAARALPGVAAVLQWADLAPVCRPFQCVSRLFPGLVSPPQYPLANGRVAFQGEPVVLALAASRARAEDALEAVAVDFEPLEPAPPFTEGLAQDAPRAHPGLASNLAWSTEIAAGDVAAAFAAAALVHAERLVFTRKTGVPLEPRGILARYEPAGGTLELRISHQMPHQMQLHFAELLGLPMSRVRVVAPDVGGAFGIKMHVYPDEIAVAAAARLLGRPVKFVADRIESMASDVHAREHVVEGRIAVDADGRITAFDIGDRHGIGAYSVYPRSSTMETLMALRPLGAPYAFSALRARAEVVLQNRTPTGQYRSVGHPIACAVTERLVEGAARALGRDPLAFRRANYLPPDVRANPLGVPTMDLSHAACLDRLEALIDLPALRASIAAARAAGRALGLGFAAFVELTASGSEVYGGAGVPVAASDTVTLALEPDGTLKGTASVAEIGQGTLDGLAQVVADAVGVPLAAVALTSGDSRGPHGGGAWASRGTAIGGEAALGAGRRLRAEILRAAGALLQADPATLDLAAGTVVDAAGPRLPLADLAATLAFRGHELPPGTAPQVAVAHHYRRERDAAIPTNGIQAALVEVDTATGLVTALRHWVVHDCGRIVNPLLVDGQIRGGVVQGIGEALLEACRYDADGQFVTGTLADYLVPMAAGMPDIAVAHVETPYGGSELGAKGAGEAGTCAAPAAILNAVNDALAPFGAAVSELPITPLVVLRALGSVP